MTHATSPFINPDQAGTLPGLFRERLRISPERAAYRYHDRHSQTWKSLSWTEMGWETARWQAAMRGEGLQVGERVAIMMRNRPEWVMFDQAALGLGLVPVPLYTDDRADNIAYILEQTETRLLVVESRRQHDQLAEALAPLTGLKIVTLENSAEWLPEAPEAEFQVIPENPNALATIVYTSGTTGRPKGVMLSHRNLLFNAFSSASCAAFYPSDVFLSFLPLSHTLERTAGYYLPMLVGAEVAHARSVQQLASDLLEIRPSVLISVPRIYEQVHAKVQRQLDKAPVWRRLLFRLAVNTGWQWFEYLQGRRGWRPSLLLQPLWQRLVGKKILERLGGRLRLAVCGGAPLSQEVAKVFVSLGLPLVQGYGLTEASPVISVNRENDNLPSSIGTALPGIQVALGDKDELLTKSPCVMLGYWNNPQATAEILDSDGWLHTGDRASMDENGHLFITGRIKDIIVLSNGEKIPPQDMEMAVTDDPLFEQVVIVGEGRPYLTALVVINPEILKETADDLGLSLEEAQNLDARPTHKAILRRLGERLKPFPGYAQVRRISLFDHPWTLEQGLVTPTLKLKRARSLPQHQTDIESMYRELA